MGSMHAAGRLAGLRAGRWHCPGSRHPGGVQSPGTVRTLHSCDLLLLDAPARAIPPPAQHRAVEHTDVAARVRHHLYVQHEVCMFA